MLSSIVVHALNRRLRVKVPAIRKDPQKAYILEILLRKRQGIKEVRSIPHIAGVVIFFDPLELALNDLLLFLDSVVSVLPEERLSFFNNKNRRKTTKPTLPSKDINLAIEGMTCSTCALLIEFMLNRHDDIDKVAVNFASCTAAVSGTASSEEVFDYIRKLGYTPRPMDTLSQRRFFIEREKELLRKAKKKVILSSLLTLPVVAVGMVMPRRFVLRLVTFLFTTAVVFGPGKHFFAQAFNLARQGRTSMDTLIAIGAGSAYLYSTVAFIKRKRHLYFDAAGGIITLILFGRYLEDKAKGKASEAIRGLIELQPLTATVIRGGEEKKIGIDEVVVGDEIIVRPGERIPVDGEVISGTAEVDESIITGESVPVTKEPKSKVTGATININGIIRFKASAVGADTILSGIIKMVDQAQSSKVPVQRLADKVSSVFIPVVMGIAGLTFLGWKLRGYSLLASMMNSVAVLLVACPCSIGLATPTAVMAGTGKSAKEGVFIRNAEALETACKIDVLIMDKTGTITEGRPLVTDFLNLSKMKDDRLIQFIASAENCSEHPVGKAVMDYARSREIAIIEASGFKSFVGKGIKAGCVNKKEVVIGNAILFKNRKIPVGGLLQEASRLSEEGKTPVFIGIDNKAVGLLVVADDPRKTSSDTIKKLRSIGIETIMVTGDNAKTAGYIAEKVGIGHVIAQASPGQKVKAIKSLKEKGWVVGMVGDGINDAPALAAADVGFAIGTGTDIAIETAQVTLVSGDISKVLNAVLLSRKTMTVIKQNLFWSFAYNTLCIPLAAFGALTPAKAAAAMALSSVSVVTNSLRLQKYKSGA